MLSLTSRWWKDRSLRGKGAIIMAVPLLALTASSVLFLTAVGTIDRSNRVVDHSEEIRAEVEHVLTLLVDAETGVRGYLLTRQDGFLEPYRAALRELPEHRAALAALGARDPAIAPRLDPLSRLVDARLSSFIQALTSTPAEQIGMLEIGKEVMDDIRRLVAEMDGGLAARLARAEGAEESAMAMARAAAVGSVLLGLLAGFIGIRIFVRGVARGVGTNTENAERLALGMALGAPPDGADEIGRSGRALVAASERLAERDRTIRENELLLRLILARIGEGVVVADPQGAFVIFNEAAEEILGLGALARDPSEWSATYGIMSANGEPFPPSELPLARALRGELTDGVDLAVKNPRRSTALRISVSGRPVVDEDGRNRGGVVVFRDVTEERERERRLEAYRIELERLNQELHAAAMHDSLTGLANPRGFEPLADQLISIASRRGEEISVLFIDIDGLKAVNDRLGHDFGSRVIVDAGEAVRAVARTSDVPARVGGDEFCILLLGGADAAHRVASRLREQVARFNATSRRPYDLSLSIGCATSLPRGNSSLQELMRQADAAMYRDKRARRAQRRDTLAG